MMKRVLLISFLILGLTASYGFAQMGQGHMDSGQGMMSSGQGMMGQGNHPCMEREGMMGSGMMRGMMGRGHMGRGMMGYGYQGDDPEAYQQYMDDTAGLRKKIHNKKFEYSEAARNPDTTRKSLLKLEKEIIDLKWKIYEQAPGE